MSEKERPEDIEIRKAKEKEEQAKKKYPYPYPEKEKDAKSPAVMIPKKEKLAEDIMAPPVPKEGEFSQMQQPMVVKRPLGRPEDSQNKSEYIHQGKKVQESEHPTETPPEPKENEERKD